MNHGGSSPRADDRAGRRSRGQATTEFALLLPIIALLALAIGQVVVVARDRVMLTHSAREGARVAAVGGTVAEVRSAVITSSRLAADRLDVAVQHDATTVVVTVRYLGATDLPLVGALVRDVEMTAVARMRRERPP